MIFGKCIILFVVLKKTSFPFCKMSTILVSIMPIDKMGNALIVFIF